ncbi:hypothetical protein GJ744_001049 [Endocarpon pusillum]|uniref:Uncharacterized protein n=1 Tax=Endocarpon pusillum TaxID=364733 RepID=A0A8H7E3L5_9EURO|nr:hypothetical protein GJ744_001049 [Endocarpon pusillum]
MASSLSDIPIRPRDPRAAEQWMLQYRDRMKLISSWPTTHAVPQTSAVRWCLSHQEDFRRSTMKEFGQNLRLFLNLEHNLDVKDPMRLLGKSGRWVLNHRKLREDQELRTGTVVQETDYLRAMDDWVRILTDWDAVRSGRTTEEAVRAQRASEMAREGMALRQRERIQAEEAQREAERLSIVNELEAIEKAAEGRREEEEELDLTDGTPQSTSRVSSVSQGRIATPGPSQAKRARPSTTVSSASKRSKRSDLELAVSAFGETSQAMANAMTSSLGQFGTQLSEAIMASSTASARSEQLESINEQLEELKKSRDEDRREREEYRREREETKTMLKGIYELLTKKSNEDSSK